MHSLPESFLSLLGSTWGIILMLLFFNGSIIVHEYGHFLAARWRGLKVTRFSLFGLGPKLLSWKGKDGVEYCICALPFGAYVALPQLAEMKSIEGDDGEAAENLPPLSYADKMIVAAAGPLFNILFAAVLAGIVWWIGYPQPGSFRTTTIGYVAPLSGETGEPSPAARAGLQAGDRIVAVDGTPVSRFAQVTELIALGGGRDANGNPQAVLTIERDGTQLDITLQPELVTVNEASGDQLRLIDIYPAQELRIGSVVDNAPAARAGLQAGDILLRANGQQLHSLAQFSDILQQHADQPLEIIVRRDQAEQTLSLLAENIALTRPLARIFAANEHERPLLEIIPIYPQAVAAQTNALPTAAAGDTMAADTTAVPSLAQKSADTPAPPLPAAEDSARLAASQAAATQPQERDLASPATPAQLALFSLGGAPASLQGYEGNWYLEAVDGVRTDTIAALITRTNAHTADGAAPAQWTLLNSAGERRYLLLPARAHAQLVPAQTQAMVGFALDPGFALGHPSIASQFRQHLETTFRTLKSLVTPSSNIGIGHLSGPVGIGRAVYSLALSDIRLVLWFTVLLNINLAILNLLPIPVLDGGHMTIATIARFRGRPLPESLIMSVQSAFMFLLLGLMIYILFKDSMRWYGDNEAERAWQRQSLYRIPSQFSITPSAQPEHTAPSGEDRE